MSILLHSLDSSILDRWTSAFDDPLSVSLSSSLPVLTERLSAGWVSLGYVDLVGLPGGAETLQRIGGQFSSVSLVGMAAVPEPTEGVALIGAGIRGYCNRLIAPSLLAAVRQTVEAGEIWAGGEVLQHLLAEHRQQTPDSLGSVVDPLFPKLTEREREISDLVANGLSNKLIAARLGISERTVKAHLNAVFRKTGLSSRTQLALAVQSAPADSCLTSRAG
jgi:DNA-binding NarL/FixJ family response regulator